jgi:sulfite reductase beta subunit-like hemoprotein
LQGVCPNEVGIHVRSLIEEIATDPEIRDQQRNLPRKHKISVAGCDRACAQTLINCQGWVPIKGPNGAGDGWRFHAGGGLGARPYTGKVIFDWVPQDMALYVARATVEAFRRHGNRRNRALARLKIVVDNLGPHAFGLLLLDIMRERGIEGLERITLATDPEPKIKPAFLDGQAVIAQRQNGLSTVRAMIRRSEIKTACGRELCRLADEYGRGEIMLTNRQNVEIRHVPDERVNDLVRELNAAGCATEGHERLPDIVSCVGTTQCKLAVANTPKTCFAILDELGGDEDYWREIGALRINMNGCPNNCGHSWIADIGLRGRRRRGETGRSVEGFSIYVGGRLSGAGHIAEQLVDVDCGAMIPTLRGLLETYRTERADADETFGAYCERVPVDELRAKLLSR